ncbi:retrovirus-related pol polyprotein from transposon TNT 1-94 [Tanacetum coccineum]
MHDPREPHLNAIKCVLRYLRVTTNLELQLFRSTTSQLIAYSDADWAGCPARLRSTSGYCVFLGDNLLTWSSKRQDTLSRSSAKAEYHGVANVVAKTSWIRNLLRDLHTSLFTATLVYCDNSSRLVAGHVRVLHIPSQFQYADIFTKCLPYPLSDWVMIENGLDDGDSIPCSPECKIVGQVLLDHPLSYALTATADVSAVYSQQFWKTVSKVPDTKETIKFKLDSQEITYTTVGYQGVVDKVSAFYTKFHAQPWQTMFKVFNRYLTTRRSGDDQTKINILQLFHVVVNCINVDYVGLLWWDLINCVFQKKDVIQYPHFTKLRIVDLMKKFPSIPRRLDEDYHSIKDDILLVSVYLTGNVLFRGMPILDAFLTDEIRATNDYAEYEMVFVKVAVPMNQPQPVFYTQGTHRTTPRAHRTPTFTAASPQGKKRKQSARETSLLMKSLKVTIKQKQVVQGEKDEESYASKFAASMLDDDIDNFGNRLEPGSHT